MSFEICKHVDERKYLIAKLESIKKMNTENTVFQPACRRQCNASKGKICEDIEKHHERFETKDLHDKLLCITCH